MMQYCHLAYFTCILVWPEISVTQYNIHFTWMWPRYIVIGFLIGGRKKLPPILVEFLTVYHQITRVSWVIVWKCCYYNCLLLAMQDTGYFYNSCLNLWIREIFYSFKLYVITIGDYKNKHHIIYNPSSSHLTLHHLIWVHLISPYCISVNLI